MSDLGLSEDTCTVSARCEGGEWSLAGTHRIGKRGPYTYFQPVAAKVIGSITSVRDALGLEWTVSAKHGADHAILEREVAA